MSNLRASRGGVKSFDPSEALKALHLFRELVRRDLSVRFTGSALGVAWAVLQPLTLVAVYWFVFSIMIPRGPAAGNPSYVYFLIAGLIPWIGVNEGLIRATTSIVDNASVVRRMPLRSDLLVMVPIASAIVFQTIALLLFSIFLLVKGKPLGGLWILPPALVVQFLAQAGIAFFLSAMYVFFRDVLQVASFALSILFYLSPILYSVHGRFQLFFAWNPMTPLLGLFRSALLSDPLPAVGSIVFLLTFALLTFVGGVVFFRRAQPNLVDLI